MLDKSTFLAISKNKNQSIKPQFMYMQNGLGLKLFSD